MCDLRCELAAAQVIDPSAFETDRVFGRRISHGAEYFMRHGQLAAKFVAGGSEFDARQRPEVVRPVVQSDQAEFGRRRPARADFKADTESTSLHGTHQGAKG